MKKRPEIHAPGITDTQRRKMLGMIGGSAALSLTGSAIAQSSAGNIAETVPNCVVVPRQTEGPYFIDEQLHRADIRTDPTNGSIREGLPLRIILRVAQLNQNNCTPLSGAMVDLWQCDAVGEYAGVRDRLYDTRGHKYLRGYQLLDENGLVEFMTVYPGWYPNRTVHVHFKVRTEPGSSRGREFSSQLYFDDNITDQVHQGSPYASIGQRSTRNSNDGIYRREGEELMLQLTPEDAGYTGFFELALDMS